MLSKVILLFIMRFLIIWFRVIWLLDNLRFMLKFFFMFSLWIMFLSVLLCMLIVCIVGIICFVSFRWFGLMLVIIILCVFVWCVMVVVMMLIGLVFVIRIFFFNRLKLRVVWIVLLRGLRIVLILLGMFLGRGIMLKVGRCRYWVKVFCLFILILWVFGFRWNFFVWFWWLFVLIKWFLFEYCWLIERFVILCLIFMILFVNLCFVIIGVGIVVDVYLF